MPFWSRKTPQPAVAYRYYPSSNEILRQQQAQRAQDPQVRWESYLSSFEGGGSERRRLRQLGPVTNTGRERLQDMVDSEQATPFKNIKVDLVDVPYGDDVLNEDVADMDVVTQSPIDPTQAVYLLPNAQGAGGRVKAMYDFDSVKGILGHPNPRSPLTKRAITISDVRRVKEEAVRQVLKHTSSDL